MGIAGVTKGSHVFPATNRQCTWKTILWGDVVINFRYLHSDSIVLLTSEGVEEIPIKLFLQDTYVRWRGECRQRTHHHHQQWATPQNN